MSMLTIIAQSLLIVVIVSAVVVAVMHNIQRKKLHQRIMRDSLPIITRSTFSGYSGLSGMSRFRAMQIPLPVAPRMLLSWKEHGLTGGMAQPEELTPKLPH